MDAFMSFGITHIGLTERGKECQKLYETCMFLKSLE